MKFTTIKRNIRIKIETVSLELTLIIIVRKNDPSGANRTEINAKWTAPTICMHLVDLNALVHQNIAPKLTQNKIFIQIMP